ncbi:hypothetical protein [Yoonia sp.]|uniref:hypothetical protein n=1 Tax=Yoonia sp. TaxID=2212373 RepID=UPI003976AF2E
MSISLIKPPRPAPAPPASPPVLSVGDAGIPARQVRVACQEFRTRDAGNHIVPLHGHQHDPRQPERPPPQRTAPAISRRTILRQPVEERIANAMRVVAELLQHDEAYLPVYLRLEAELHQADARRAALERAKSLLQTRP